jgi:CheY-like chemotaxis protein
VPEGHWHATRSVKGMDTVPLVLVVDDSAEARVRYRDYLAGCGFRVLTAEDGEEAVRVARAECPAAVVIDLPMPNMDGCDAIRQLRADPMTADIPIVAVSTHAFGREAMKARDAGADLCLSKPCLPPQVARVVRAMIAAGTVERPPH